MALKSVVISGDAELHTIEVQPGEVLKGLPLILDALLASGEVVSAAQSDDPATVPQCVGVERTVRIDIVGPGNGEQRPVRVTVEGSKGSLRYLALVVKGHDPITALLFAPPARYLKWRGAYDPEAAYVLDDLATYDGLVYLGLAGSRGKAPDLYPELWFPWPGVGQGGGEGGGPASYTRALRGIGPNGDTYEATLGTDEFGGITLIFTNLTGGA